LSAAAVRFGTSSVKAALEADAAMARVKRMVDAAGISWDRNAGAIEKAIDAQSRLFKMDDEALAGTFANFVRQTKDINEALTLNADAANLSRGRQIELERAAAMVLKINTGNFRALKSLGIATDDIKTKEQALAVLRQQFAGQAETQGRQAAGRLDGLRVGWENLQETIGKGTLPVISDVAAKIEANVLPQLDRAADRIGDIFSDKNLDLGTKFERSWDEIQATGLPDRARSAILEGFAFVGANAPRAIINAMADAPWEGKVALGALLLAKFGPAFRLVGAGAGKALGAGAAGTVASKAAPVPVFVVNNLPGSGGGGVGGAAGKVSRAAGALGAGAIAMRGAGAIGALALGGAALNKLTDETEIGGAFFESKADEQRSILRMRNRLVEAARQGAEAFKAEWRRRNPFDMKGQADSALIQVDTLMNRVQTAIARGNPRKEWQKIAADATRELGFMTPVARNIASDTMVRFATELERKGQVPRGTARRLVGDLTKKFGELPEATRRAADQSVPNLERINRVLDTMRRRAAEAIAAVGGAQRRGDDSGVSRARGGVLPGTYNGRDNMLIAAASGETFLTPHQVHLVDLGMSVRQALAATGGVVGGTGFATGGVVEGAVKFARAQVGEPYVWGGGHSFGDHRGWDCSGFASNVAARVPGYRGGIGTTMTLYPRSRAARGGEPVVFGFRGMSSNDPRKQHMGIRVAGTWFSAGGRGARTVKTGDSAWEALRVPPGLENLTDEATGDLGPEGTPDQPTPLQRLSRAITRRSLGGIDVGAEAPSGMSDAGQQAVRSAAVSAGSKVLASGAGPEAAREAADDARRAAEIQWWTGQRDVAIRNRDRLVQERGQAIGRLRQLYLGGVKRGEKQAVVALQKKIAELNAARDKWNAWLGEVDAQLFDLGVQEAEDRQETGLPGDSAGTVQTDGSLTADQEAVLQAQLEQANQRAQVAANATRSLEQFLTAALSPGDLSGGGLSAWQAAGGTLNLFQIQALTLGDPQVATRTIAEIARAGAAQAPRTATVTAVGP
jgi:hypothetical protein